jgi:hypothetical protein
MFHELSKCLNLKNMKAPTKSNLQNIVIVMITFFALYCFESYAQPKTVNAIGELSYVARLEKFISTSEQNVKYIAPKTIEEEEGLSTVTAQEAEEAIQNMEQLALKTARNMKYKAPAVMESLEPEFELAYIPELQSKPVKVEFHQSSKDIWLTEAGYYERSKSTFADRKVSRKRASAKEFAEKKLVSY